MTIPHCFSNRLLNIVWPFYTRHESKIKWAFNIHKELSSKSSREDMCRLPTSFLLNIQSRVKQEGDMPQIQNCITRYSSPYWCSVPNIRKLACVVPEKNVTEIFCDADDDDDARRQKWSLYVAYAKAGRRHNDNYMYEYLAILSVLNSEHLL